MDKSKKSNMIISEDFINNLIQHDNNKNKVIPKCCNTYMTVTCIQYRKADECTTTCWICNKCEKLKKYD